MMIFICLGYICALACYLTLVGTWMNQIHEIATHSNLEQSLHHQVSTQWWLKTRKHKTIQTYPLTNSMLSFMIVTLDTQVLFLARTNPCRQMNSNSKWCSQLFMSYINLEQPTQVQLHDHDQHHHPRYVIPYQRSLTSSDRSKQLNKMRIHQMLKRKMVTPF